MNYQLPEEEVKQYVTEYFADNSKEKLVYHDIRHTETVVAAAKEIASHYQLSEHDYFIVVTAAWFHDMGYCSAGTGILHELRSAGLADSFLKGKSVDETTIIAIESCVLATKMPQNPHTLLEKIVCDADLFHLGTNNFAKHNKQIRKEYQAMKNIHVSKDEWRKGTIQLLQSHQYHTDYCRALLSKAKQANLEKLVHKQISGSPSPLESSLGVFPQNRNGNDKEHNVIKKEEKPSRGIETMFRITVTNHQRLSDMADKKANIMITVNSIIISVVIGLVIRKLETTPYLVIPTMLLLIGSASAVVFSILATRPKIPDGYFSPEQLSNKTANLLFFGNFYKMDYEQYYDGMQKVMADGEFLYASLIRDIHSQGKVLGNKYQLLRISYTIFMYTLIIAIIAFSIAFMLI
ncbi:MAG: Pycsar system effector family protein [Ferruginibacter sp.]